MTKTYEAVVVGAGMFGAAAAKYLSRAGAEVMVVGPEEPPDLAQAQLADFGAHFDEARITRRLGWDPVWGALDARSLGRFRDIEAEAGTSFFQECGSLVLMARSITHRTDAILDQCGSEGIDVERLSADAIVQELPALGAIPLEGGTEGLLERKQAGYLNPRQLVAAQLNLAQAAGARLLRATVTSVSRDGAAGPWRIRTEAAGAVEEVEARQLVVAAGAMANLSGALPPGSELDFQIFTEPNLLYEVADEQLEHLQTLPAIVTVDPEDTGNDNMTVYLLPPIRYPDGKWYVRIGPGMQPIIEELETADEIRAWYSAQRITPEQADFLSRMMRLMVPSLAPVSVREACCIIEKTPSRYPYIGHLDGDDSLTVVAGGNGHGARGSDEIGRLAARIVLGEPWDCPIPQETFQPRAAPAQRRTDVTRPGYLKPPFGLC
ncbi:FAD-dependent oxidoreductase [Streptomyces sp. V4-01]|uniref:FAD-dependent oxidoreductase n=1 Tax=Actinacidiphila polyblastidii TaxID=3110430 RepID=A0ABU7P9V6_9ACTN|nr:FAD-dependent oxidoreductase [Streptomyces sp. V4-01]